MTKAGRQVTAALAVASAMTVWGRASANEEPICCRTCSLLLRSTSSWIHSRIHPVVRRR